MSRMIEVKLAELASVAESAAIKERSGKFWDGELREEICRMSRIIDELKRMTKRGDA